MIVDLPHAARMLRAIRKQRGWTQCRLAAELSVSERTVSRWETGALEPNSRDMLLFRTLLEPVRYAEYAGSDPT